ncbi:hypothetical protein GEV27_06570 [Aeromicrobium sp. S22]|uniref:hypothetical protein n=1 Tax=Aeromicrobium sp. S22 TaxID=2662029 RepID=UPI00129D2CAA|nr:hypothetical protein [Aeromicrobium sp. S22]MRK01182.1 hypothetical protein [Aeromicrobium sp. S22]
MSARGRRLTIFLPVLVTLALGVLVGLLVVVQAQRQNAQVVEADDVATQYLADVSTFRSEVGREVRGVRQADPGDLRRVLRKAVADPPELGDAPSYGTERSEVWQEAVATQQALLQPYRRLDRTLRRADVALAYIETARKVLGMRASDYVGTGVLSDSAAVRARLIPAFARARAELDSVRVPQGQQRLAATVRGAVQYVIDQATALADSVEANRGFSFTYAEQFQTAIDAVDDYATVVNGDVAEAINAVTDPG